MDLFYKPPLQRPDECSALEENYINCLLQKSLRDRVLTNRCNMDSILWFHLECPKAVAKFDDPFEFKRKFRDFFADVRTAGENATSTSEETRRIADEYTHISYPEDVREHKEYRLFQDTFKQFSPVLHPEPEEEWDNEDMSRAPVIDKQNSAYGKKPWFEAQRPIRREEGLRGPQASDSQ